MLTITTRALPFPLPHSTSPSSDRDPIPSVLPWQVTRSYSQTAVVTAGKVTTVQATMVPVSPGPTPHTNGQITVRSSPSGANIYLDNSYRGLTPLTLVDIPQGSHAIILKLNGYQDWQSSVNVPAGSSTDVSGTLASSPQPTPTTLPEATRSPISPVSILVAIGICSAAAILYRKSG